MKVQRKRFENSNEGPDPSLGLCGARAGEPSTDDTTNPTIDEIIDGPFRNWIGDIDFSAWETFLKTLFGLPLNEKETELYQHCTHRKKPPKQQFEEAWCIAGRRGGKSVAAAIVACFLALYGKWTFKPGETVRVLILAVSKNQARIIKEYALALLQAHPALQRMIQSSDQWSIQLTNGIEIFVATTNYRSVRGPTVVCAIFEEVAFWYEEGFQNPDTELLRAVRPSMATVPNALLLGISSPYARKGLLWDRYKRYFGKANKKVLIWQADTRTMNPSVSKQFIADEYKADPQSAAAEYGANFRDDISTYLSHEVVSSCIETGLHERGFDPKFKYHAFVDPAGGSGKDSMTLAIAHEHENKVVLDALREIKPKFSPQAAVADFSEMLKAYRIRQVIGDRFAGEFPREAFRSFGIQYRLANKSKNDLYRDLLPTINSGGCQLLDNETLINQLTSLERRTGILGKDVIDHPRNGKDDLSNAAAGVIDVVLNEHRRPRQRAALIAPRIFDSSPGPNPLGYYDGV